MDSAITAAVIGAFATIAAVIIGWWLQQNKRSKKTPKAQKAVCPDGDDIYFMQSLLHDAYERDTPMSTIRLAEQHSKYAPLELEAKLIRLEKMGYIQRVNKKTEGMGWWQMLPSGVDFMFSNGHQLQDILDSQKSVREKYSPVDFR